MEVHHHPNVEKKNFKEYLLEGLMIFLAVSMGFIAENVREKISEHEIEKRNMEIIVDNLKEDTTTLVKIRKLNSVKIQLLDSIIFFQKKNLNEAQSAKIFTKLYLKSSRIDIFKTNKAAYEQMKSSGSLRLIKRKMVLDSLFNYSNFNERIDYNYTIITENYNLSLEDAATFVNFNNVIQDTPTIEIKNDPIAIFKFFNHTVSLKVKIANTDLILKIQLGNATRLIQLLKKEYNID